MPDGEIIKGELPVWKTPYNHDTTLESRRTALYCADESLTKQEFVAETDINVILERFMKTGEPPPMALPEHFLSINRNQTWFELQSHLAEANAMFYTLPPALRAEHLNDPARWADAVVKAVERDSVEDLRALGIDAKERPKEPKPGDPLPGGTPAPGPAGKAPEAPKPGDTPKPPSDKEK